jgi:hypothetical protein
MAKNNKRWESVDALYFRKMRGDHYKGAYKARRHAEGATGDSGPLLPRGIAPGSEAARVYLSGGY